MPWGRGPCHLRRRALLANGFGRDDEIGAPPTPCTPRKIAQPARRARVPGPLRWVACPESSLHRRTTGTWGPCRRRARRRRSWRPPGRGCAVQAPQASHRAWGVPPALAIAAAPGGGPPAAALCPRPPPPPPRPRRSSRRQRAHWPPPVRQAPAQPTCSAACSSCSSRSRRRRWRRRARPWRLQRCLPASCRACRQWWCRLRSCRKPRRRLLGSSGNNRRSGSTCRSSGGRSKCSRERPCRRCRRSPPLPPPQSWACNSRRARQLPAPFSWSFPARLW